jgi:DNA-binding response OmpR family regulator
MGSGENPVKEINLLIVEDHQDTAQMLEVALRLQGYEVRTAATVAEARECLANAFVDLVVTDWILPDGTGKDVCDAARAVRESLPIVALSAIAGNRTRAILECKPNAFFVKPVYLKDFFQAVRLLAEQRHEDHPADN